MFQTRKAILELCTRCGLWLVLGASVCTASIPVLWVVFCSGKAELFGGIPDSVVLGWSATNFAQFVESHGATALLNSLLVGLASSTLGTTVALLLSFGLICRRKPLIGVLVFFMSGRLLPAALFLLPQFLLARMVGLTESRSALSLAHAFFNASLGIILLGPFVLRVHRAVGEQIYLDRAPGHDYFFRVICPLVRRPLVFCLALTFMMSWTDYFFASLFVVGEEVRTVPVLIGNYLTSYATLWGPMYAAVCVSVCASIVIAMCGSATGAYLVSEHSQGQETRRT